MAMRKRGWDRGTYGSHNGTLRQQSTEDLNAGAIEQSLDSLASGHIRIRRIG